MSVYGTAVYGDLTLPAYDKLMKFLDRFGIIVLSSDILNSCTDIWINFVILVWRLLVTRLKHTTLPRTILRQPLSTNT